MLVTRLATAKQWLGCKENDKQFAMRCVGRYAYKSITIWLAGNQFQHKNSRKQFTCYYVRLLTGYDMKVTTVCVSHHEKRVDATNLLEPEINYYA